MVEEQLQLERAREAELETLYREEAARQWEKRENQWQREGAARERLMREVLEGMYKIFSIPNTCLPCRTKVMFHFKGHNWIPRYLRCLPMFIESVVRLNATL